MTGISTTFNPVNDIVILIVFVGGVLTYARTHIPRQTIKDLQDHVAAQELTISDLKDARIEDAAKIGKLEGIIQSYEKLPFASFEDLSKGIKVIADSNKDSANNIKAILDQLKENASIAAEDRDILTNQNIHIATEVDKRMKK